MLNIFLATTLASILLCGCPGPVGAMQARAKHAPLIPKDSYSALIEAATRGNVRAVRSLLRKGVDGYAKDHALMAAAAKTHLVLVKILLRAGANPNAFFLSAHSFSTPLGSAIRGGSVEVIDVLIRAGAELNPKNTSLPLSFAVGQHDVGMVKALIARGADVNLKDHNGTTALILASAISSAEVVKALIDAKADVNLKDDDGNTALAQAEKFYVGPGDKAEIVRLLKQAGAKE